MSLAQGFAVLYLCGMYTHTTKSGQTDPSRRTHTIRDPTDPLARIFFEKLFDRRIVSPDAGSVHLPSSSIFESSLVIQLSVFITSELFIVHVVKLGEA